MPRRRWLLLATAAVIGCGIRVNADADADSLSPSPLYALERSGSAPTVLFIHGFGQSTAYWQEWVDLLGNCGIHAVALDLPGFGRSARSAGPYTIEGLADAVAHFIEERKLGAVTLAGNSMGSTVAQFVALRHPRLVGRLLLTATSAVPPPAIGPTRDAAAARSYWETRDIKAMVDGFFESKTPPPNKADAFYEAGHQMNVDAAVEANDSNLHWTTLERLHEIKVPVLIIQGRHDVAKSPAQGALMVSRLRHANLVVLESSAHTPQWDQPNEFQDAALPFLLAGHASSGRCTRGRL